MNNLFFQDKNQIYNISLSKVAYEQMLFYCEKANSYETGGILVGNYSLNQTTANILQITEPPKNSKQAKYNFHRIIYLIPKIDVRFECSDTHP